MSESDSVSRKIVMTLVTQDSSIAAELRDDILRGRYRCGERLPSERDLAERFGVHRSTVRAAFKRLEQLGIADIRQGGARVSPIEEASLDVIQHLLALEDPPDPELVDQTLETMSGFLALAARLGTERASDEQREAFITILDEMLESDGSDTQRSELFSKLSDRFVEASGNTVLHVVRHGLWTRYAQYVVPDHDRPVDKKEVEPSLKRLKQSIGDRAPSAASEAIYELTAVIRRHNRLTRESNGKTTSKNVFPQTGAGGTR
jgi:DNA-binding FadR family transcriptional regulator